MRAIPGLSSANAAISHESQSRCWQSGSAPSSDVLGDTNLPLSPKTGPNTSPGAARSQFVDSCTSLQGGHLAPSLLGIQSRERWQLQFLQPGPTLGMAGPSLCALGSASCIPITGGSWHSLPASSLEPAQMLLFSVLKPHQTL